MSSVEVPDIASETSDYSLRPTLTAIWGARPGIRGFLSSVDHKTIGIRYIVTAFVFLIIGGIEALIMRLQLAHSDLKLLSPEAYDQLFTTHGFTMIFLYAGPVLSGFSNYLFPLLLGSRDMAFPRLNALSYWVYVIAGIFFYVAFPLGISPDAGWFNYPPYSSGPVQRWPEHRFLSPGTDLPRYLHDGRGGQFRGNPDAHARARHVDQSFADPRVGHPHGIGR